VGWYAAEPDDVLLQQLARLNETVDGLGLDEWRDVTSIVLPES
jgi:hypothetical protein